MECASAVHFRARKWQQLTLIEGAAGQEMTVKEIYQLTFIGGATVQEMESLV